MIGLVQKRELDLIADIYDAVLDASRWATVVSDIACQGHADRVLFTVTDLLNPTYNLNFSYQVPSELIKEFREDGYDALEFEFLYKGWLDKLELGTPVASNLTWGGAEAYRLAGGKYVEFLNRWGVYHQAPVLFERGEYLMTGLGLNNGKDKPFEPDTLAFLRRITPHMRRAMQVHRQMTAVRRENERLYAMMDKMAAGVLLLDVRGRIVYGNPRARALLNHPLLQVRADDGLVVREPSLATRLRGLVEGAIRTGCRDSIGDTGGVLVLPASAGHGKLVLSVLPLSALSGYDDLARDSVAAAIFLTDPAQGHTLSQRLLRESFGLTEREAEVCQWFVNAPGLEQIAGQTGLTLASVRTYMRDIYQKTGKISQAELMRLLLNLTIDFQHIQG